MKVSTKIPVNQNHPGLVCVLSSNKRPGRSTFNKIECQMVKFRQELSRMVLPHDKFGFHLKSKRETIEQS